MTSGSSCSCCLLAAGLLLAGLALPAAAAGCGDQLPPSSRQLAQGEDYTVAFAPSAWPIPVGRHFSADVVVCALPGAPRPVTLRVDADMPAHRHGMNYRASVRHLGQGRFAAEGLMFHMSGRWRYVFEVDGVVGPGPGQGSDKSVLAFDFLTEVE